MTRGEGFKGRLPIYHLSINVIWRNTEKNISLYIEIYTVYIHKRPNEGTFDEDGIGDTKDF